MDDASQQEADRLVRALRRLLSDNGETEYSSALAQRIEMLFEQTQAQFRQERAGRLASLTVHGLRAAIIGALIIVGGAPGNIESSIGLFARPLLGYLALLAGVFMLAGPRLYFSGRNQGKFEVLGLAMVGFWDALFAASLVFSWFAYPGDWVLCWPWELKAVPPLQPRIYAPFIYLALTSMVWGVHLRTTLRERRGR